MIVHPGNPGKLPNVPAADPLAVALEAVARAESCLVFLQSEYDAAGVRWATKCAAAEKGRDLLDRVLTEVEHLVGHSEVACRCTVCQAREACAER